MAVTLKDIALLAGVSRQAVSAVLNNNTNSRVSKENRKKILEIAKAKNYKANHSARHLRGMPTRTIGILNYKNPSGLHRELFSELNKNLFELGYRTYYAETNDFVQTKETIADFVSRGVEGIISSYVKFGIKKSECTVPLVSISPLTDDFDIYVDNFKGGYLAAEHLISHGYKKIALLTKVASENSEKLLGMKKALYDGKLSFNDNLIVETMHNINAGNELINLIEDKKITAFFVTNDYLAGKFLGFLNKHGYKVPEQIAVIGYDGMSFSEFTNPPLTTIIQPIRELAKRTVELMQYKIKNKVFETVEPIAITPKLFLGTSCGCKRDNFDMLYWEGTLSTLEMLFDYNEPLPEKEISL